MTHTSYQPKDISKGESPGKNKDHKELKSSFGIEIFIACQPLDHYATKGAQIIFKVAQVL